MNEREKIVRLWFDMWLKQQDMGIDDIFTETVIYTESWGQRTEIEKQLSIGLMNGIPVAELLFGILSNFAIKEIKHL